MTELGSLSPTKQVMIARQIIERIAVERRTTP
jgi:hypothetical protein